MRFALIHTILALIAHMNLELLQMDVKTTFFHGELDELIFMEQPNDFAPKSHERKVCRLKQCIYGLKQLSGQ